MHAAVHGLHHVTCIAGDPQENLDFYTRVLGMRLVKQSVNQDVPDTYHLFYADAVGTPGTDLTFFPWPEMERARPGIGLAMEVAFAVPPVSLTYWRGRLEQHGVRVSDESARFGEPTVTYTDPHGLALALVGTTGERPWAPWPDSTVPMEYQIRGMHSVRLWERDLGRTHALLMTALGFAVVGEEDGWVRFAVGDGGPGRMIDVREFPDRRRGAWGIGGVHHVAWRVTDGAEQAAVREAVERAGRHPTPVIDRFWFQSVYFTEPGGVLFELATDGPGFARDESAERLGEQLILPPWLEARREEIEAALPVLGTRGA